MRNVTIKRHKAFAGCLMKMKLYVEDAACAELHIGGVPCRKLGELKNGEEKTFPITDDSVRIFAIADKASKEFCVDCYRVAEGQEDVVLSGKNKFNLANGNAFRFDNNDSEEARMYRKKGSKTGIIIMCVAALVGFAIGFLSNWEALRTPSAKTFTCDEMSMTLTDRFEETAYEGLRACYESGDVLVFVLKEEFSMAEGLESLSLEQYGELVKDNLVSSSFEPTTPVVRDDRVMMQYHADDGENSFVCDAIAFKGTDAFWIVRFVTLADEYESYSSQIEEWASSITFGA